jgi:hypothetical protein
MSQLAVDLIREHTEDSRNDVQLCLHHFWWTVRL